MRGTGGVSDSICASEAINGAGGISESAGSASVSEKASERTWTLQTGRGPAMDGGKGTKKSTMRSATHLNRAGRLRSFAPSVHLLSNAIEPEESLTVSAEVPGAIMRENLAGVTQARSIL